ncbi:MAG: hypothetical protein JWM05_1495 [Acidimicrobiales bacterium]|nr:hypothetical protein [Acidimicrobiales bacterium]
MPRRTLILLPPSEAKAPGGEGPGWAPGTMRVGDLDRARATVLNALGSRQPAVAGPTMPAIERYRGVLYRELDAASLGAAARRRLGRWVLTMSGLWGVVAPDDPIPEYKLKMSASVPRLGKLSTWWRPQLTVALAPLVRSATVWDLLPLEHTAAWVPAELRPKQRITVRFVDAEGRTISHWNKLLKGSLVRWLVATGSTDPADLPAFDHPLGYQFDPSASDLRADPVQVVMRQRR